MRDFLYPVFKWTTFFKYVAERLKGWLEIENLGIEHRCHWCNKHFDGQNYVTFNNIIPFCCKGCCEEWILWVYKGLMRVVKNQDKEKIDVKENRV